MIFNMNWNMESKMNILTQLIETEERIDLDSLIEKKDHLIKKMPLLDDEQKKEIIKFFTDNPSFEHEIDWNKTASLEYSDFEEVLAKRSKRSINKAVKSEGIKGLIEGKDYVEVTDVDFDPVTAKGAILEGVYIPITYEASKHIASSKIGGVEAKWCIGWQKSPEYWFGYTFGLGRKRDEMDVPNTFPMFIFNDADGIKYALQYNDSYRPLIWNEDDNSSAGPTAVPGIDINKFISKHKAVIDKAHALIDEHYANEIDEIIVQYEDEDRANDSYLDEFEDGAVVEIDLDDMSSLHFYGPQSTFIEKHVNSNDADELVATVIGRDYNDHSIEFEAKHIIKYDVNTILYGLFYFKNEDDRYREIYFENGKFGYYDKLAHYNQINNEEDVIKYGPWVDLKTGDTIIVANTRQGRDTEGTLTDQTLTGKVDGSSIAVTFDLEFWLSVFEVYGH